VAVDSVTAATTTTTLTESESNGVLVTVTPPLVMTLPLARGVPPCAAEERGSTPCLRGDYLCSIFSDLTIATSTFAQYMCSCLSTAYPGGGSINKFPMLFAGC
jgi:hypothetical protein